MLKILQMRLQYYMTWEFPDVQAVCRKWRGTRDQIANICWIIEKAREFQKKHLLLLYWLHQSLWLCVSQQTMEKSSRDEDHLTCLLRSLFAGQEATVRTGYRTMDWFQIGKGVCPDYILSPHLFNLYTKNIMQMPDWMKHKLESRLPGEISVTSDMQITPPLWQRVKRN